MCTWEYVRVHPAVLNRLLVEECLEVVFHSNSYKGYKLTEQGKLLAACRSVGPEAEALPQGPIQLPDDLFDIIEGYQDIKGLVKVSLQAKKPVHVLFTGVPSSAKTMFLLELARLGAPYILGSQSTKAGIAEVLFDLEPQLLLVDEIDRIGAKDIAILLSLMQTGIVSEAKAGRRKEVQLQTRVFAASNTTKMPCELLSRFLVLYFKPYSREEFLEVTTNLLRRAEKVEPKLASYVAQKAWDVRGVPDPREAVRISRLAKSRAEVDRVCEVLLKYSAR